jgi:ubiquinone/menaquinone biosynthesis C-methylase UbiE
MQPTPKPSPDELYAQLYDVSGVGWPGEMEYYLALASEAKANGHAVLEVACGTGRIAIALAQQTGCQVSGVDLAPAMIEQARRKTSGMDNVRWVAGDMRSFDAGGPFGLAIIPGHSFQFMTTPEDQVACLECIQRHLLPGGKLVVHIDHPEIDWLAGLPAQEGVFEAEDLMTHPQTGQTFRPSCAWTYERGTHTASAVMAYEEIGADGQVIQRYERAPLHLHVVFRYEMEHLLRRVGFKIEALYGSFNREEFRGDSSQMVWEIHS